MTVGLKERLHEHIFTRQLDAAGDSGDTRCTSSTEE